MRETKLKLIRQKRRLLRTRKKVIGISKSGERPRLSLFRSNRHMYAQIIDDRAGQTIVAANEGELEKVSSLTKIQKAEALAKIIAGKASAKKINKVVFDKGSYRYHGRVKAFADAARREGLQF